jgi:hypothetical protein
MILDSVLTTGGETFADEFRVGDDIGDSYRAHKTEMLVRLIRHLEDHVVGPRVSAIKSSDGFWLTFAAKTKCAVTIKIGVDSYDRSQLENGMPLFHYRVNYSVNDELSVDRRSRNLEDVAGFVLEAIHHCR